MFRPCPLMAPLPAPHNATGTNLTLGGDNATWQHRNCSGMHIEAHAQTPPISIRIHDILEMYVTPCICGVGCIGNILSLIVFCKNRFRKTDGQSESGAHLGLAFLAVSDFMFCVVLFPRTILASTHSVFTTKGFQLYYQLYGTGLVTTFILMSTWITVVMALLRFFSICHPLTIRKWDALVCAKVVYPLSCILCILLNIPSFFQFAIVEMELDDEHLFIVDIGQLDSGKPSGQAFLWFHTIVAVILPALILTLTNYALIRALRNSHRIRLQSYVKDSPAQRSRKWITVTLVAIAVCFITLVFPGELMDFFIALLRADVFRTEVFLLVRSFANVLQVTNFALNFVLYCIINVHFRGVLLEMCRCAIPLATRFSSGNDASGNSSASSNVERPLVLRTGSQLRPSLEDARGRCSRLYTTSMRFK